MYRGRILIIEDDPVWRDDLAGLLKREGFECLVRGTYLTALDVLERHDPPFQPDALVLDLSLQKVTVRTDYEGWELAGLARSQNIASVIITAHAREEYVAQRAFREFAAVDFLDKSEPGQVNLLAIRVAEAVEMTHRWRAQREAAESRKRAEVRIQFESLGDHTRLRAGSLAFGEPCADFLPPLSQDGLARLLSLVQAGRGRFDLLTEEDCHNLGVDDAKASERDFLTQVGMQLYRSLAVDKVGHALTSLLHDGIRTQKLATLQLQYNEASGNPARYPWELIHDGNAFLARDHISLVRYVSCSLPVPAFQVSFPLRVLYVVPRPVDLPPLGQHEKQAIASVIAEVEPIRKYRLDLLSPPCSYEHMMEQLDQKRQNEPYDVVLFDGHGKYGWCCSDCHCVNDPDDNICHNLKPCGGRRGQSTLEGYMYFEDVAGNRQAISASRLATALVNSGVQIAALSACDTGKVGGETLHNAVAPKLVARIVPVVIAMQFPIPVLDSLSFFSQFFRSLGANDSVSLFAVEQAVHDARKRVISDKWFYPVLYVRAHEVHQMS